MNLYVSVIFTVIEMLATTLVFVCTGSIFVPAVTGFSCVHFSCVCGDMLKCDSLSYLKYQQMFVTNVTKLPWCIILKLACAKNVTFLISIRFVQFLANISIIIDLWTFNPKLHVLFVTYSCLSCFAQHAFPLSLTRTFFSNLTILL